MKYLKVFGLKSSEEQSYEDFDWLNFDFVRFRRIFRNQVCKLAERFKLVMKKILLLSDTHSHIDDTILKYVKLADEVWHAGDIGDLIVTDTIKKLKPLRAVYGNIDDGKARLEFPLHNRFTCEGVDVWITHIGGYPGKYNQEIRAEIRQNPPKLFICGHSHILKVQFDKELNVLHMNPGAAGKHGFHQVRTMLQFEIDGDKIQNLNVIELGNRV